MPFFSSIVVIVAVVTLRRTSNRASLIARLAMKEHHAGAMPSRSSRRRSQATNGIDSSTIQRLADDLPEQKIERTEGEPQEYDRIDDQPDDSSKPRRRQPDGAAPAACRRQDRQIRKAGRRRRGARPATAAPTSADKPLPTQNRQRRHDGAQAPLHQIAQHQRDADHHHARRRHQAGRDRHDAGAMRRCKRCRHGRSANWPPGS